jgi:hypothetical protein
VGRGGKVAEEGRGEAETATGVRRAVEYSPGGCSDDCNVCVEPGHERTGRYQESDVMTCARRQDIAEQTVFAGPSGSTGTSCDDPLPCAVQRAAGDGGYE